MKKIILALVLLPSVALADWAIPPTLGNPGCTTVDDFIDGPKGAEWRPGNFSQYPTFYLPADLCGDINYTQVWDSGHQRIIDAVFVPYTLGSCGKDGRVKYKVPMASDALALFAPLVVRLFLHDGTIDCRTVEDPTQNYN